MSTKVTTNNEVRLSYTNLIEPRAQDEAKPDVLTFSSSILIPKSDTATVEAVKAAIAEALADGIAKKWGGKKQSGLRNPLRDGDEKTDKDGNPDEVYAGHWYVNAKGPVGGKERPILLDSKGHETLSASVIYSGVYGRVSIQFYAYDKAGNKGVACGLVSVLSSEHGDPLGNTVTAESAAKDFGVSTPAGAARDDFATGASAASDESAAPAAGDDGTDPWE